MTFKTVSHAFVESGGCLGDCFLSETKNLASEEAGYKIDAARGFRPVVFAVRKWHESNVSGPNREAESPFSRHHNQRPKMIK